VGVDGVPGVITRGRNLSTQAADRPIAVIDVGSNSIRLVVYEAARRVSTPVFNEKVLCGLGRGLDSTGRLHPDGVEMALDALQRFAVLTHAMGVDDVIAIATAAVREAEDGAAFIAAVERRCGLKVLPIPGQEEARLSALGALSAIPDADGLVGDLGGASFEVVHLESGALRKQATLPIGPIRLADRNGMDKSGAQKIIDTHLAQLDWLKDARGKTFYAIGGAWRALARIHMNLTDYPLLVAHHYEIPGKQASSFAKSITHEEGRKIEKFFSGVSRKRLGTLPFAALLLNRLIEVSGVSRVVISAFGLREGCLFDRLPTDIKADDPLIDACRNLAWLTGRATADGEALYHWMAPAFPGESEREKRLRRAACLLADLEWSEHPDYRVEHALLRILRYPMVGVDHPGRAYMGLAVASRHAQVRSRLYDRFLSPLLDDDEARRARATGLAMRLGYTLSGGVISLLEQTLIRREGDKLIFELPDSANVLVGDVVQRRFRSLAKLLDCKPRFSFVEQPTKASAKVASA
jgi:exopolyphosphatase/guanosine-5'-triphosphate,3'-diphosphate pyrophosphatase